MPGPIDAFASEPHYAEHLVPVWLALPPEARGTFWVGPWDGDALRPLGIEPVVGYGRGDVLVAASYGDLRRSRHARRVLLEHGIGQSYGGDEVSARNAYYTGGRRREWIELFLTPSESVARQAPGPAVAVGCPRLDRWHAKTRPRGRAAADLTVALGWHWDAQVCPETGTAWWEYRDAITQLTDGPWRLLGHGHPRAWGFLGPGYDRLGVSTTQDFAEVLDTAAVYCADNSSSLYEFASIGCPVVVLNSRTYRRDVEHGKRFWDWADVGVQVDRPEDWRAAIEVALEDPPEVAQRRAEVVAECYVACDGRASERAAAALLGLLAT